MFAVMDCLAWAISPLQNFLLSPLFFFFFWGVKQDQVHIYSVHRQQSNAAEKLYD